MRIIVTCQNKTRKDFGKTYHYRSLKGYLKDKGEREHLDSIAKDTFNQEYGVDIDVKLPVSQIGKVIRRAKKIDLVREFGQIDHTIGNVWKNQKVIDFDRSKCYVDGEDVAQSMYNAIVLAWSYVAKDYYLKEIKEKTAALKG
jgi:hypothetical protein